MAFLFDDGKQISGGEWQKLAIARAIIKNSSLILLDEPNSSLDPLADKELSDLYKKISGEKILFVVVHRSKNVINIANKILVLKDGKLEAYGSHEELLKTSSYYKDLYINNI